MARSRILDILKTMAVLAAATAIGFLSEDAGTQLTILITFLAAVFTSSYTVPGSGRRKRPWPGLNSSGAIYCVPTYLRVFMASLRKKIEKNPSQPQYIQIHVGVGYRMMKR